MTLKECLDSAIVSFGNCLKLWTIVLWYLANFGVHLDNIFILTTYFKKCKG